MSAEEELRERMKTADGRAKERIQNILALFDKKKEGKLLDYGEVMKITCWGSLAYCCRTGVGGKSCPWRDATLELLGITHSQFEKLKAKQTEEFGKLSKAGRSGKKPSTTAPKYDDSSGCVGGVCSMQAHKSPGKLK